MANVIQNGDFERALHQWVVQPEYWSDAPDPLVETQEAPIASRGQSLYIELARWVQVEQQYPWVVYAEEGHLHFSFMGEAADFYVNIYYEGGAVSRVHFYGHWPIAWEDAQVPVSVDKGIIRIEFLFVGAMNFYLDDISLEGSSLPPSRFFWSQMQKVPGQIYDDDMTYSKSPVIGRLEGIELELKRISALLAQQQDPDIIKNIDAALEKRVPKGPPVFRNN